MESHDPLSMSKSRKRPPSRGSTASVHSATTQPNIEQSLPEAEQAYAPAWIPHSMAHGLPSARSQPRELAPAPHQMSPEDLLMVSHLQQSREFSMESTVGPPTMHSGAPFHHHHHPGHGHTHSHSHSLGRLSADSFQGNASFADDSHMLDRDGNDDGDSFAGMPGNARSGSRSSANNETEMRQLFVANKHRKLEDVAEELHGNERGPNSERTRQIFAMLWINSVCSKGKGSVPRGRVYASYASRCAGERITVLNPASFGKLVRVLFPGLKTRRLGVRGESKYHYVNFCLAEEHSEVRDPPLRGLNPLGDSTSFSQSFNTAPAAVSMHQGPKTIANPTASLTRAATQPVTRSYEPTHGLYNQPLVSTIEQMRSTMTKTAQLFCLSGIQDEGFSSNDPLMLPAIESFLPTGTDPDAAMSLAALYLSHCTSLVECIRYCREKTFFHLFNSFQGTLTMPVHKLFGNPALAPWIEEADFVMYQRMMRIISGLTLQVVPKTVLDTLRNISERLVPHIRESFHGQPNHVVRAKEAPATIFAALLDRALRVNLTAHAAANMLSNPANRDLMYAEWMSLIQVRKLAESVPARGMDDLVSLLLGEMRELLDPIEVPFDIECTTLQGLIAMRNSRSIKQERSEQSTASNVLDRWVNFLRSLPTRFPYASPMDIVLCVERVGTTLMRDLTISQGKSFGSWWVTKCWIDEMIRFLAEQGGFIKQKISQNYAVLAAPALRELSSRHASASTSASTSHRGGARYSSGSDDLDLSRASQPQTDRAEFPSGPSNGSSMNLTSHDDSGIGIRTPDEESPMGKFGLMPVDRQDPFNGPALQNHMSNI